MVKAAQLFPWGRSWGLHPSWTAPGEQLGAGEEDGWRSRPSLATGAVGELCCFLPCINPLCVSQQIYAPGGFTPLA